jgi:2-polyprenyl-6-methoxyphenol hydroxylase-like FAD-dependent oxidoreductase
MYDAIVVGARCAGSPTAMLLARKGYRVLLLDRATFPSDTPKGHFIQPSGVAYLERWGLLGRVVAAGTPAVRRTTFALAGSPRWPTGQVAEAYAPRRSLLDQILVEAAVAAGAELRERYSVEGLVVEAGRVTGIRGRVNGRAATESARIVIGADGIYSRVARAVDAPAYQVRPALSGAYWGYWSGVSLEGIEFSPRDGRLAGAFLTNDDLVCVWAQWRHSEFHAVRGPLRPVQLPPPAVRARLGAGGRRRVHEGPDHRPGHRRRLPRCRAADRGAGPGPLRTPGRGGGAGRVRATAGCAVTG